MPERPQRLWAEQRAIIEKADLTKIGQMGSHKLILLLLHGYADPAGTAWPSHGTLAAKACMGASTVQRVIKQLEAEGLVSQVRRTRGDGGFSSNIVAINFDRLEELAWNDDSPKPGPMPHIEVSPCLNTVDGDASNREGGCLKSRYPHASNRGIKRSPDRESSEKSGDAPEGGSLREWTDYFVERWAAHHNGVVYPFDGAKDGQAAARARKQLRGELDRWRAAVDRYMADQAPFIVHQGHKLSLLVTNLPNYVAKHTPTAAVSAASPEDRARRAAAPRTVRIEA